MKKVLLSLATALLTAGAATAQVTTPTFYSENFVEMGQKHNYVSDGWTATGVDASVVDILQGFFPEDDPEVNPYMILTYGATSIAMTATNFTPPTEADQWLISPEIEIPADAEEAVLAFTVYVYGGTAGLGVGDNPFKVYVSTSGTEKADFGEPIYDGVVKGSQVNEMVQKQFCIPMNGLAGKKVHLAFQAGGMNVGCTGFSNIVIGNYYASIDNLTPIIGEIGKKYTPRINVKLKTPVECPGIKVLPYIDDVAQEETYYKKNFGGNSTTPVLQLVQFKDMIEIKERKAVNYRIEITPDYEGAVTSLVIGSIGVPEIEYISNVVVEEVTASGCQYCPSGTAALEYYHDTYPGTETQGKSISIAVHSMMNYYDPMMDGVSEYVSKLMDLNAYTGLPQAMFNRNTSGLQPTVKSQFEAQMAQTSYNKAEVVDVLQPMLNEGETMHGKEVTVKFDVRNAYTGQGVDLSAAVVLIENNVKGNNSGYNQNNAYATMSESSIVSNYGQWLVPYMKKYLPGGEWGRFEIPFDIMVYNHVARGIYPDFYGQKLGTTWEADQPQQYSISFEVPQTVKDWNNTEVVVLVFRNGSVNGKVTCPIVGSDNMGAADFTTMSGVKNVGADVASIARDGDNIVVNAAEGSVVSLYTVEGMMIGRYTVAGNSLNVNGADLSGMVIVKVENAKGATTAKLLF